MWMLFDYTLNPWTTFKTQKIIFKNHMSNFFFFAFCTKSNFNNVLNHPETTILPDKWLMRSMHKNHQNMPHQTYHSAQWLYYVTSSQFPTDVTTNIPTYTNSSGGLTRPAPASVLVLYKTYERRVYLLKSD